VEEKYPTHETVGTESLLVTRWFVEFRVPRAPVPRARATDPGLAPAIPLSIERQVQMKLHLAQRFIRFFSFFS